VSKKNKVKLPDHIKRMIKEVGELSARTKALGIALVDDDLISVLDENQVESMEEQFSIMEKYIGILQDRISYDAMKEAQEHVGKNKDVYSLRITKNNMHIVTEVEDAMDEVFDLLKKKFKGSIDGNKK
jgi:hypothetical protein